MSRAAMRDSADRKAREARASSAGQLGQTIAVSALTRAFRDLAHAAADEVLVRSRGESRALAEAARGLADSALVHAEAGERGLARTDAAFAAALAAAAQDTATRARNLAEAANSYESELADHAVATARYQEPGSLASGMHARYRTEPAFPTAVNDSVRIAAVLAADPGDDTGRGPAAKFRAVADALTAGAEARARDRAGKVMRLAQEAESAAAEATQAAEDAAEAADACTGADGVN
ncbi:hypothetical protein ACRS6B_22680 [Nocardia asteroides]